MQEATVNVWKGDRRKLINQTSCDNLLSYHSEVTEAPVTSAGHFDDQERTYKNWYFNEKPEAAILGLLVAL